MNPFLTFGYHSAEYFCDRVAETEELTSLLTNGNNVTLISPRRMGKTGLLNHCFAQPKIRQSYNTFIIDIYATKSLQDMVFTMGKTIVSELKPRGRHAFDRFLEMVTSLKPGITFDEGGNPTWNVELGDIKTPTITLDEIFAYLENADKPCLVAIDEFQSITEYPEKNIEELLRTYVQRCKQTWFVFCGSQRSMMGEMFQSPARPFYQSTTNMPLRAIPLEKYLPFAERHFHQADKYIAPEAIRLVYDKFEGTTWYLQKVMNELWRRTSVGKPCLLSDVEPAITHIIQSNSDTYQDLLYQLTTRQKELLYAICREGKATQITGSAFIKKYRLTSASSTQKAAEALLRQHIITHDKGSYEVYDKFFALWMKE